jgi:signal peptidase I
MNDFNELARGNGIYPRTRLWRLALSVFGWVLIVFFASYLIVDAFFPNYTVYCFGLKPYVVQSESMVGKFNKNDVVFDSAPRFNLMEVGDIITYKTYARVVTDFGSGIEINVSEITNTHYLASIDVDNNGVTYYRTMPYENFHKDRSEWDDSLFDRYYDIYGNEVLLRQDDILGETRFSIPFVGVVGNFFQNILMDKVFVILIVLDAIVYATIFEILWDNYRESTIDDDVVYIKGEPIEETDEKEKEELLEDENSLQSSQSIEEK